MRAFRSSLAASRAGERSRTRCDRGMLRRRPVRNLALASEFVDGGSFARDNPPRVGGQRTKFGSLADVVP